MVPLFILDVFEASIIMQKTEIATETGWSEESIDANANTDDDTGAYAEFEPQINEDIPVSVEAGVTRVNDMLLDASDRVAPSSIGLEKPMWRHPFPRAVLVLVGSGALVIAIIQLTQGNYPTVSNAQPSSAPSLTSTSTPRVAGSENGELQSRLATVQLNLKLQKIKEQRAVSKKASSPISSKPNPRHVPQTSTVATREPRQVVIYRTVATKPNPRPLQAPRTWAQKQSKPKQAIDPQKQWLAVANIGSYGQISNNSNIQATDSDNSENTTANAYETQSTSASNISDSATGGIGLAPERSRNKLASNQTIDRQRTNTQPITVNHSSTFSEPGDANLNPAPKLVVGTKATAKLQTPIAWSGEVQNPNQNFLVQLSEPLKGSDSSVLIPTGAYLVARVSAAGLGGIIQMSAVSYLFTLGDRTIERPLPQGAILILGKGGRPLQAKLTRNNYSFGNVGTVLLSGAAAATSLVNQATSQSYLGNGGSFSTTTTTSPNPNYVARFGQGVADGLLQQIQESNQRARQQSESQLNVYILAQNTKVQVFVNSSVSLQPE